MSNKASQAFWNQYWTTVEPCIAPKSDPVRRWIEGHFPTISKNEHKTFIEIGCYPGQFLSIFGELGYELFGVDLAEKLELLPKWLKKNEYKVGLFWKEDFSNFNPYQQFDVVASFGFIEHFTNWNEILIKHTSLVKDGGYLILEVPNFVGVFQRWFHVTFDNENYKRHHIPAMKIEKWVDILTESKFDIIYKGYFGKFDFWVESHQRTILKKVFLKTLEKLKPRMRLRLPRDKKIYSPFGGIIAQKS